MNTGLVRLIGGASLVAAIATFAGYAEAAPIPLPDATYYNAVNVTLPNSLTFFDGGDGHTSANIDESVYPGTPWHWGVSTTNNYAVPSLSAKASGSDGVAGNAGSSLVYYVSFLGAPGDLLVTVHAAGSTDAAGPNDLHNINHNEAVAGFWIDEYFPSNGGTGDELVNVSIESNQRAGSGPGLHTFTYDQQLTFHANAIYQVTMQAIASSLDDHTSTATIDPFFTAPSGYTLLTSAGIGNGAGAAVTPIPAALPLMAGSLGALGLLGWRRRARAG
jgi:hypothetical protein